MTEISDLAAPDTGAAETNRRTGGLSALRLAELQALAGSLGLAGTAKMRKSDLVSAIKARQNGGSSAGTTHSTGAGSADVTAPTTVRADHGSNGSAPQTSNGSFEGGSDETSGSAANGSTDYPAAPVGPTDRAATADQGQRGSDNGQSTQGPSRQRISRRAGRPVSATGNGDAGRSAEAVSHDDHANGRTERTDGRTDSATSPNGADAADGAAARGARMFTEHDSANGSGGGTSVNTDQDRPEARQGGSRDRAERTDRTDRQNDRRNDRQNDRQGERSDYRDRSDRGNDARTDRNDQRSDTRDRNDQRSDTRDRNDQQRTDRSDPRGSSARDDDDRNGRRRGRQRYRDRKRRGSDGDDGYASNDSDGYSPQGGSVGDDDVLIPVAGILDVLDNYAFVRTSGYLPGPNDVYVPLGIVKKNGLRKGDAVTGAVRALREGEQIPARQKYNALVRLDTVNGMTPDESRTRVEFGKLTPLYPQERLRLETEHNVLTTRIIDLVAPIGKGQRGLIVSPPKAGKTLILQAIANAIAVNNPEAHLMIVLVDERPEEVTDMQRTVKGEVIASTFDRPAEDHTTVAELAIERAKRLVEMGHDVVVLLDSITRLGRAYNLAAPASGRILSGGVDSSALYPPKRFFGAARNIENGGSLTILATALVETGSKMDEVIFEEFKGTGNMELRLSRTLADRRIFPAVDVNPSGTRREEILMAPDELKITWRLRRVLSALDQQQGIELLLDRLKKTRNNIEFLMQVQKNANIQGADED